MGTEHKSYIDSMPDVAYHRGNDKHNERSVGPQSAPSSKIGDAIMRPTISIPRSVLVEQIKRIFHRFEASGLSVELATNLNQALLAAANDETYNAVLSDFVRSPLRYLNA